MSKDTNMLFKPAMVRGLLNGSKTMTRRLFPGGLVIDDTPEQYKLISVVPGHDVDFRTEGKTYHDDRTYALFQDMFWSTEKNDVWIEPIIVPQAEVGDRIYVRETHYRYGKWVYATHNSKGVPGWVFVPWNDQIRFEDDMPDVLGKERAATMNQWWKRPSLFHHKGHTRIILECTEKKVERLWDITEEDAKREGVEYLFSQEEIDTPWGKNNLSQYKRAEETGYKNYMWHGMPGLNRTHVDLWPYQYSAYDNARDSFFSLWASINGAESYQKNPWLVAVGFKRVL